MLYQLLLLGQLSLYGAAPGQPFYFWYSAGLHTPPVVVHHYDLSLEGDISQEAHKVAADDPFNPGGTKEVWNWAYFAGVFIKKDDYPVGVSVGAKFLAGETYPYAGVTLPFSSLLK